MEEKKPQPNVWPEAVILLVILLSAAYPAFLVITGNISNFFQDPYIQRFIFIYKVFAAIVTIVAVLGIIYVAIKAMAYEPPVSKKKALRAADEELRTMNATSTTHATGPFRGEWNSIRERLKEASDSEAGLIILEADGLVDRALQHMRITGETMGERLKSISGEEFKGTQDFWDAHKIRNELAHGEKQATYIDAMLVVDKYEKGLKELGLI